MRAPARRHGRAGAPARLASPAQSRVPGADRASSQQSTPRARSRRTHADRARQPAVRRRASRCGQHQRLVGAARGARSRSAAAWASSYAAASARRARRPAGAPRRGHDAGGSSGRASGAPAGRAARRSSVEQGLAACGAELDPASSRRVAVDVQSRSRSEQREQRGDARLRPGVALAGAVEVGGAGQHLDAARRRARRGRRAGPTSSGGEAALAGGLAGEGGPVAASSRSTLSWLISGCSLPGRRRPRPSPRAPRSRRSRPERASDRAATRSPTSRASSSKERTNARPHQVSLRATAPRRRGLRGRTSGSGIGVRAGARAASTRSRSSASDSSVRAASPRPSTASARLRLRCSSSAIRSSMVPSVTRRCTWTGRVWPIRWARSVAWSSTAGFHQRSKWITWSARVRLRPVPPALSESRNTGAAPSWKSRTICSRARDGGAAVQEQGRDRGGGEVAFEQAGHRDVLGEDQHRAVLGQDRAEQLVEQVELLGAALEPAAGLAQVVGRVVADLLEPGEQGQHQPAPGVLVGALDAVHRLAHERLVEHHLLAGQADDVVGLGLGGQLGGDAGVGLAPAQQERLDELGEPARHRRVDAALDRRGPHLAEGVARARAARESPSRGSPTARSGCSRPGCRSARPGTGS